MSQSLDERENDQRFAAEEEGFKFIKIILSKKRVAGIQKQLHIHGVKALNAYSKGKNDEGIEEFEFERTSGIIKFKRDRRARAYVGYLWDDDERGYYSRKGFNRDFLATHLETGDFIIKDETVLEDVKKRLEKIKKVLAVKSEEEAKEVIQLSDKDDIDDIEEQIKFLSAKKEMIKKKNELKVPKRSAKRGPTHPATKEKIAQRMEENKSEPELQEA